MKQKLILLIIFLFHYLLSEGQSIDISGPTGSVKFGSSITVLTNGNYVVTDPNFTENGAPYIGAVHLYNGITHQLISTLKGSRANDMDYNYCKIYPLVNGNFVVLNNAWDNGSIVDAGAVTFINGETGLNGIISSQNSLVSNKTGGFGVILVLKNGNFLIISPNWSNGTKSFAGAITFGNGQIGITGLINEANSLIGGAASDYVGNNFKILSNGNLVFNSPTWDHNLIQDVGAVTFYNIDTGVFGLINSTNSLVGSHQSDMVGWQIFALKNGNYVVKSEYWDYNGIILDTGAVTWGSGTNGVVGEVNLSNSFIGDTPNSIVGNNGITELTNGNYIIKSNNWGNGIIQFLGAITWANGNEPITGILNASNSLIGSHKFDHIGSTITPLKNGNYLVGSPYWNNSTIVDAGAITFGYGNTNLTGEVTPTNSLVGSNNFDNIGGKDYEEIMIQELENGNYLISSPNWDFGNIQNKGAITWVSATTPIIGEINAFNSVIGGLNAYILSNGNYVVQGFYQDPNNQTQIRATALIDGTTGLAGEMNPTNSIIGINGRFIKTLTNGNYVIGDPYFSNNKGSVTWRSGTDFSVGSFIVNSNNSLIGNSDGDRIGTQVDINGNVYVGNDGQLGAIFPLSNGNYVVGSNNWKNGTLNSAGAVTLCDGSVGTTGVVNIANSIVGGTAGDRIGSNDNGTNLTVKALKNGNFLFTSSDWGNPERTTSHLKNGSVTFGNGNLGINGLLNKSNSIVSYNGGQAFFKSQIEELENGDIIFKSNQFAAWIKKDFTPTNQFSNCNAIITQGYFLDSGPPTAINKVHEYLIAGSPAVNKITVMKPSCEELAVTEDEVTTNLLIANPTSIIESTSGRIIATINPNGNSPVSGLIESKVWVDNLDPDRTIQNYVARHYQITPTENAEMATGKVTLYYTQQEFDDYNAVNDIKLPSEPNDLTGKSNLKIEKYAGISSATTGLPNTYSGTAMQIDPLDEDIIWNASLNRWEVTFDVVGFSGFFCKRGNK